MSKDITIGIEVNYDRITGCYMDKVTHNPIKPQMKEYLRPTISIKDNEIKTNEPRHKPGYSTQYLSNIITKSAEMEEKMTKLYGKEYLLIDETLLQHFLRMYVEESVKIGTPTQAVITVSNSADYLAQQRILKSAEMAGLHFGEQNVPIQVVPSSITPFVSMQNFDPSYHLYEDQLTRYIFIDVNGKDIHFIYGVCDRREQQRKVVMEKIHRVPIGFESMMNSIKEFIMTKHEETIENEEYEEESMSPLRESAVSEQLEDIISRFTDSKVDTIERTFEDEDEVEAVVTIKKEELEELFEEEIQEITEEFRNFLEEIQKEQSNEMNGSDGNEPLKCIVEYIGRYSRFKILEEPLTKIAKECNHEVRYTSNREAIMAVGSTIISRLKIVEDYDISCVEEKEKHRQLENQKIYLFSFDMFIKQHQIVFKNVTNGEEKVYHNVYYNVLKDRYEVKLGLHDCVEGMNMIEIDVNGHCMMKGKFTINKKQMISKVNRNNVTGTDAKHAIVLYAYLNGNESERKLKVYHQKQFQENCIVYHDIPCEQGVIQCQKVDVEFVEKWTKQQEVIDQLYVDREEYETYRSKINLLKNDIQSAFKTNSQLSELRQKTLDYLRKKMFSKAIYDELKSEFDKLQNKE